MEPKIRYNGYTNKWDDVCLNDIVSTAGIKNRENLPLVSFSITNDQGFVPQDDKFENGGTMRDANKSMYYIVSPKTFAYNPARINVGSIGYYDLEKDVIISSLYVVFKTDQEKCDDYYFLQWFKSDKFKRLIEQYQEGGVRLYFFYDKLCKCHVHIPSKEEQHKISSYFRVLDFKLQASAKKLESLKKLKSASLVAMFPQQGKTTPKVRFKGFEGEWKKVKFLEIFEFLKNNSLSRAELSSKGDFINIHYGDILIKYGDLVNIQNEELTYIRDCRIGQTLYKMCSLQNGDIIIADAAEDYSVGKCSEIVNIGNNKVVSGLHTIPCRPLITFAQGYLGHYINSNSYHNQLLPLIQGSKISSISKKTLSQTSVFVPSYEEQQAIATFFRSLDRKIALETARLEKLKQIKLACLDKMFV